jgi:uncharacterized protein
VAPGEIIRAARKRHRVSQQTLALRAGTNQAAVSRIERGEISPSIATVDRLLAALGERLSLATEPMEAHHDPLHVRAMRERKPEERLELAISWNRLAGDVTEAGRRARGE